MEPLRHPYSYLSFQRSVFSVQSQGYALHFKKHPQLMKYFSIICSKQKDITIKQYPKAIRLWDLLFYNRISAVCFPAEH